MLGSLSIFLVSSFSFPSFRLNSMDSFICLLRFFWMLLLVLSDFWASWYHLQSHRVGNTVMPGLQVVLWSMRKTCFKMKTCLFFWLNTSDRNRLSHSVMADSCHWLQCKDLCVGGKDKLKHSEVWNIYRYFDKQVAWQFCVCLEEQSQNETDVWNFKQ